MTSVWCAVPGDGTMTGVEPTDNAQDWPGISAVMPVVNEENHLATAVAGVLEQGYPGELELIIAVGPSQDRTAALAAELAERHPQVQVVDNPAGKTPHGLNLAIARARHDIIVRVDGHGELAEGYLAAAVRLLERTGAVNVGGVMDAKGHTPFQQAAAAAYTSRLGLGGGSFHHEDSPEGEADTVFLGVFRADALRAAGGFDESMHRAQDWELNHRLRQAGGLIWFSPELKVTYYPRSTPRALWRQFYLTGKWRREVIRLHPETASARYLAPPAAVLAIGVGTAVGLPGLATRHWTRWGLLAPLGYLAGVSAGSLLPKGLSSAARAWLPLVYAIMHVAWGLGFLVGLSDDERRVGDSSEV